MTITNGTKYEEKIIRVKGNDWSIMLVSGKLNYVEVFKLTNNPYGISGKRFDNMDAAIDNYKTIAMKAALIQL